MLSIGYAAFQTSFIVNGKGTIIENTISVTKFKSRYCNATSGDGLYVDPYENNRCIYKGANPNNYLLFNDELWRIVSIESDNNVKIIKNSELISNISYDDTNPVNRYASGTYCSDSNGCNIWSSKNNTYDNNGNKVTQIYVNGNYYDLPDDDSKANRYLNSLGEYEINGYYNNLSNDIKDLIVDHDFYIGPTSVMELPKVLEEEKAYVWKGKVGLLDLGDVLKSKIETSTYLSSISANTPSNWYWLINPLVSSRGQLASIHGSGVALYGFVYYGKGSSVSFVPVLFLKDDIILSGSGTKNNPYQINSA